jgi:4-hydroxy-tetrahydrodipicolinate synthase
MGQPFLFRGVFTALVTPFKSDAKQSLDQEVFEKLVWRQIEAQVAGVVVCGTTGEAPTLSDEEDLWLIQRTVELCRGSGVRVIVGTGSNDTWTAVKETHWAEELGADAALVVAPYYNKPDQRMLEAHFLRLVNEVDLPIILYNIPGRTGVNLEPATVKKLAQHPRIVGIKDAANSLDQYVALLAQRPEDFAVLAGDDLWTLPLLVLGGDGVVSVAANEIPVEMVALVQAGFGCQFSEALGIYQRYAALMKTNFSGGPNPVPVKAALSLMGLIENVLREPLLPLEGDGMDKLKILLADYNLL